MLPTYHTFYESLPDGSRSGATNLSYFLQEFVGSRSGATNLSYFLREFFGSRSGATNLSYFPREFACRLCVWYDQPIILSTRVCLTALGLVPPTCHTFYESLPVGCVSGATNLSYFLREFVGSRSGATNLSYFLGEFVGSRSGATNLSYVLREFVGSRSGATNLSYFLREFSCRLWVWCHQPIILSTRVCRL